jgi:hypothetical protein
MKYYTINSMSAESTDSSNSNTSLYNDPFAPALSSVPSEPSEPVVNELVAEEPVADENVVEAPAKSEEPAKSEAPVVNENVEEAPAKREEPVANENVEEAPAKSEEPVANENVEEAPAKSEEPSDKSEAPSVQEQVVDIQNVIEKPAIVEPAIMEPVIMEPSVAQAPIESSVVKSVIKRTGPRIPPKKADAVSIVPAAKSEASAKSEAIVEAPVSIVSPPKKGGPRRIAPKKTIPVASLPVNSVYANLPDSELLEAWEATTDFKQRDDLMKVLQRRNLFPSPSMETWEFQTGAYPDIIDPSFLQKLLTKREFAESLQYTWEPNSDPCEDRGTFEVTPVQRFVSNFMSPKTPYMSALLFHGVGVGKTCAGVQIIEAWLEFYPRNEVYLVAPPTIQKNFNRTIFDINKVTIGEGNEPNSAAQCTGTTYMKLTNTLYERDKSKIESAVNKIIKRRYKIFGYISFANYIRDLLKRIPVHLSEEETEMFKKQIIRQHFSGKLLLVDEAHNLRDVSKSSEDEKEDMKEDDSDSAGGKLLTPYLMDVLRYSEGMKFCALTATPMYNSYLEIIFILNLLLRNDKKAEIVSTHVFDSAGNITERGKEILSYTAQRYVSFMRGENPISFPVRLFPQSIPAFGAYPTLNPRGGALSDDERIYYTRLPLVPIVLQEDTLRASLQFTNSLVQGGTGLNTVMLEKLVHAGNIVVPATDVTQGDTYEAYTMRTDKGSIGTVFDRESSGGHTRYRAKASTGARWLISGPLERYSPKFQFFLERARRAEGCVFAYTRFVGGGALPLALVLEANGYLPYHGKALLADGIQAPGGKQCALCPRKEKEHADAGHPFSPAYYGILTGDIDISPNNEQTIIAQSGIDNKDGKKIKILIGSQIASEGVDLRFIRETHIIDSWFHLNKTEQIIGRSIRFLSHCALPKEKRNTTIYLYTAVFPSDQRETADLYSYRIGFKKAVQIGRVTRIMKQSSLDCNLNHDAIVIHDQDPIPQIDSQHVRREQVNINDMPFTAVCDWIETCEYTCQPKIDVKSLTMDDSTYDEFSARWRIHQIKQLIRERFEEQPFYQSEDLWSIFGLMNIPRLIATDLLREIVNNKMFQIRHGNISGYIRYCNGYYLFQPNVYTDLTIPLAIRTARFPVKRDQYTPIMYEVPESEEQQEERETHLESAESFWSTVMEWIGELAVNARYHPPPVEMERHIKSASDNPSETYLQILEMIQLFHSSFHTSTPKNPESFRKALLFYFWDEWMTIEEQTFLVRSTGLNLHELIRENQYPFGKMIVNRYLHPKTGAVYFTCEEGKECMKSVVDQIQRSTTDPLRQLQVNKKTTGMLYGYNVPKDGHMVFKTNKSPEVNGKIGRGSECMIVSNVKEHLINLMSIGEILQTHVHTNFNLDRESLITERSIKGSVRICTLMNVLLRFMDAERINDKRWFFRSVEAYYTGHKGSTKDQ